MKDIDETMQSLLDTQKREKKKNTERLSGLLGDEDGEIVSILDDVINNDRKK